MNTTCKNCRHFSSSKTDRGWCSVLGRTTSSYNFSQYFQPKVESAQLSFSYDANGSPTDEEV